MRLAEIASARARLSGGLQPLPEGDFSDSVGVTFSLRETESRVRTAKRLIARPALRLLRGKVRAKLGFELPFAYDAVGIGDRFLEDAAWSYLLGHLPPMHKLRVLVPGCYMAGEDVQRWLRHGVERLDGIDVYALEKHWGTILPKLRERWRVPIAFRQGSIEDMPFEASYFDVLTSAAVLEHVRNLDSMVDETARVLKPSGFALHAIGPLYYCYGADHCIAAYGFEAGYDHLLLDDDEYRRRISDRAFFAASTGNPDLAFWALNDQFSFCGAQDYIASFKRRFAIDYLSVVISAEGVAYRERFPDKWKLLRDAGISETDLLVKGLVAVVRKPAGNGST